MGLRGWAEETFSGNPMSSDGAHTYSLPGTYTVALTVTDDQGASSSTSQSVTAVVVEPVNLPPTAGFSVSCQSLDCTFVDESSDLDGQLVQWEWDFGDGAQEVVTEAGTPPAPAHSYPLPGTYAVTLRVMDDAEAYGTQSRSVTVELPTAPSGIELTALGTKDKGRHLIQLNWAGAQGALVEVWLDGAVLTATENDGEYLHSTGNKGKGTYFFKVCEVGERPVHRR